MPTFGNDCCFCGERLDPNAAGAIHGHCDKPECEAECSGYIPAFGSCKPFTDGTYLKKYRESGAL